MTPFLLFLRKQMSAYLKSLIIWANDNKMVINLFKTKEIVFKSSNPILYKYIYIYIYIYIKPHQLKTIEQVLEAKFVGVVLDHKLNFDTLVDFVFTLYSQCVYLLKLLRD